MESVKIPQKMVVFLISVFVKRQIIKKRTVGSKKNQLLMAITAVSWAILKSTAESRKMKAYRRIITMPKLQKRIKNLMSDCSWFVRYNIVSTLAHGSLTVGVLVI